MTLYFICLLPVLVGTIVFGLSYFLWWRSRWFIDAVHGSDKNHGHSVKRPLKTHAECARRMGPLITSLVTINILTDLEAPIVTPWCGPHGEIAYIGHPVPED